MTVRHRVRPIDNMVRVGSIASDKRSQRLRRMSTLPPIASEFPQREELTQSAHRTHAQQKSILLLRSTRQGIRDRDSHRPEIQAQLTPI